MFLACHPRIRGISLPLPAVLLVVSACSSPRATGSSKSEAATPKVNRIRSAVLSPGTARIAYVTDSAWRAFPDLWVIETKQGAKPVRIGNGMGASWSPDSRKLAYQGLVGDNLQIFIWDRASGKSSQLTHLPNGVQPSDYVSIHPGNEALRLSWSPDATKIVFSSRVQEPADPVGDSLPIVLTQHSPAPKVWAGITHYTFGGWQYVKGIPSGRMMKVEEALKTGNEFVQLFTVNVENGDVKQLTTGPEGAFDPTWSPDGKTIVFESNEATPMMASRLRATNLYRMDANGGERVALTTGEGRKYAPVFTRDGRIVARFKPDGSYVPRATWLIDINTRQIVQDSTRVQPVLDSLPVHERGGVLKLTPRSSSTKLEVALPGNAPFTLADYTRPKAEVDREEGTRMEWVGARGRKMYGRIRLPVGYQEGTNYPIVVDPYHEWQAADTLTAAGYIVFSPQNPRAPHDPGDFEESHGSYQQIVIDSPAVAIRITVEDIMSGVDTLIRRGMVDTARMVLAGFSNGGGAVNYLATHTNRFKCGASQSPAAGDMTTTFFVDPDGEYLLTFFKGHTPWDSPQMYSDLSTVNKVDRIHMPMLYAIGDTESLAFQTSAIYMYNGLRRLKRPVTLVRYPGQGHGLHGWALNDLATRTRKFFDECTKKGEKPQS
jgi:dipeptidyl aminopeptidase/acylaminoacyl peptidase